MVLRGVLDRPFGSCLCLRGYAPFYELAKASVADTDNYQRAVLDGHLLGLEQFYKSASLDDIFFPEVILGVSLSKIGALEEEVNWLFNDALETGGSRRKLGRITVSVYAKKFTDDGRPITYNTGSFYGFDCTGNDRKLFRIDGNHRLTAVEGPDVETRVRQWNIPYCLLFFKDEKTCIQRSATYFSNINFKVEPLSREQNIKTVVDHPDEFPDNTLFEHESYGPGFVYCRKILSMIEADEKKRIMEFTGKDSTYSFLQELGEQICTGNQQIANVKAVYELCESTFSDLCDWLNKDWDKSQLGVFQGYSSVIKAATFYYHLMDKKALGDGVDKEHKGGSAARGPCTRCTRFLSWVRSAHIEKSIDLPLNEMLRIFDSVYEDLPKKMFLARWYPESGDEKRKADARFEALNKIAKEKNLELIDMAHKCCGAFSIRNAIDSEIPGCDLFVADLTGLRSNVMVEIGMALHHLPMNRVLFYMQKADVVPGMNGPVEEPPFDLSGYSYDRIVDSSEIETLVKRRIDGILNEITNNEDASSNKNNENMDGLSISNKTQKSISCPGACQGTQNGDGMTTEEQQNHTKEVLSE